MCGIVLWRYRGAWLGERSSEEWWCVYMVCCCGGGGVGWRWVPWCVVCVFVGCLRCSLSSNRIGADGARVIGAALQHLSSLTELKYVRSMGHAEEAKEE